MSLRAADPPRAEVADDRRTDGPDPAAATAAVHVGLWVSATRCVLTYVIAPAVGALGLVLGPIGLVLQVLGAITATAGARQLWTLGHRLRLPYVAVAIAVDALVVIAVVDLVGQAAR